MMLHILFGINHNLIFRRTFTIYIIIWLLTIVSFVQITFLFHLSMNYYNCLTIRSLYISFLHSFFTFMINLGIVWLQILPLLNQQLTLQLEKDHNMKETCHLSLKKICYSPPYSNFQLDFTKTFLYLEKEGKSLFPKKLKQKTKNFKA